MKTNDIKKGMKMILNNGWEAVMMDNKRGNTRMAEVKGVFTEIGSIYVWDIAHVYPNDDALVPETVELTDKQKKDRDYIKKMGF